MATSLSEIPPHRLRFPPHSLNPHPKPTNFLRFSTKPYSNFNAILSNNTNHSPKPPSLSPSPPIKPEPESESATDPTNLENRLRRSLRERKYEEALSLVESMASKGYKLNIILCSDLIECCSGLGKIHLANRVMELVESHSEPNNFLYNVFVTGLCNNNRTIMALETLGRRQVHGCRPNILLGNILVGSMCRSGMLDLAFQTIGYLEQRYNCKPNLITYNMLVEGTVVERGMTEAFKLLDKMASEGIIPDYGTYNAIVQGMCKVGRVDEAWRFLARLPGRGFKPRTVSYCALLQGMLESKRWTDSDIDKLIDELFEKVREDRYGHVTDMVNMLCEKEMVDKAWLLIDRAENTWKLKPDIKSRNKVIYAYIKLGRVDLAYDFVEHMTSKGCDPDISTCNAILSELCKKGLVQQAMQLIDQMEAVVFHPKIAKDLWTLEDLSKATDLLSEMLKKGLKPDETIYCGLIIEFCKEGFIEEAMEAKILMEEAGFHPTVGVYNSLLHQLSFARRIAEAFDLFEEMLKKGLEPNARTYRVMLVALAHTGYALEAVEILEELGRINVLTGDISRRIQRNISSIAKMKLTRKRQ